MALDAFTEERPKSSGGFKDTFLNLGDLSEALALVISPKVKHEDYDEWHNDVVLTDIEVFRTADDIANDTPEQISNGLVKGTYLTPTAEKYIGKTIPVRLVRGNKSSKGQPPWFFNHVDAGVEADLKALYDRRDNGGDEGGEDELPDFLKGE